MGKKKIVHKASNTDDKKLQSQLKKLQINPIPGIEEVNMFKEDGSVLHFNNPKVQASPQVNTFAISGQAETQRVSPLSASWPWRRLVVMPQLPLPKPPRTTMSPNLRVTSKRLPNRRRNKPKLLPSKPTCRSTTAIEISPEQSTSTKNKHFI